MLGFIDRRRIRKDAAARLYDIAAAQSRAPAFYERHGIADTLDGRFDLLCLHVALIALRLSALKSGEAAKLSQALFDRMFVKTDRTLREMGVGDLSVPRHMKKMMAAFNGRLRAYDAAMRSDDPRALPDALAHNLYRAGGAEAGAADMEAYVRAADRALASLPLAAFERGEVRFPDPLPAEAGHERELLRG